MPGWLTLLIDLEPDAHRRAELVKRITAQGPAPLNQTVLLAGGKEAGSLAALSKDSLKSAREATADLVGRARPVRVDADVVARDEAAGVPAYIVLAADLTGKAVDHDDPAVNQAIRDYLGEYLPLLGRRFVAVSTLLDRIMYAGGLTVLDVGSEAEARQLAMDDPWKRLYPGRVFQTVSAFFRRQLPPAGPGMQRSGGGSPWPFHWPA